MWLSLVVEDAMVNIPYILFIVKADMLVDCHGLQTNISYWSFKPTSVLTGLVVSVEKFVEQVYNG